MECRGGVIEYTEKKNDCAAGVVNRIRALGAVAAGV
jgi:hypothetical protein